MGYKTINKPILSIIKIYYTIGPIGIGVGLTSEPVLGYDTYDEG